MVAAADHVICWRHQWHPCHLPDFQTSISVYTHSDLCLYYIYTHVYTYVFSLLHWFTGVKRKWVVAYLAPLSSWSDWGLYTSGSCQRCERQLHRKWLRKVLSHGGYSPWGLPRAWFRRLSTARIHLRRPHQLAPIRKQKQECVCTNMKKYSIEIYIYINANLHNLCAVQEDFGIYIWVRGKSLNPFQKSISYIYVFFGIDSIS